MMNPTFDFDFENSETRILLNGNDRIHEWSNGKVEIFPCEHSIKSNAFDKFSIRD